MKAQKSEKLTTDIARLLATIRTAAVRLEGRTKVAAQVDAKRPIEKDAIGKVSGWATGILAQVEEAERGLLKLSAVLAESAS